MNLNALALHQRQYFEKNHDFQKFDLWNRLLGHV